MTMDKTLDDGLMGLNIWGSPQTAVEQIPRYYKSKGIVYGRSS